MLSVRTLEELAKALGGSTEMYIGHRGVPIVDTNVWTFCRPRTVIRVCVGRRRKMESFRMSHRSRTSRMEGWKGGRAGRAGRAGRVEGWKGGRAEGWKRGRKGEFKTSGRIRQSLGKSLKEVYMFRREGSPIIGIPTNKILCLLPVVW